ncbi:hypothetical protein F2Q70_00041355 [Brassica cretica]|uniref:Uncharacterized protein n=1 Tax=Brassica cretica TaxID=69181 RepID=A0A8S9MGA7_BRACR|nr:hypothetical protein F2Q70_00041355 [Brassica cretica]KAF2619050.1 hypothetical protein F2Q68_00042004 [Brassica cretica]
MRRVGSESTQTRGLHQSFAGENGWHREGPSSLVKEGDISFTSVETLRFFPVKVKKTK